MADVPCSRRSIVTKGDTLGAFAVYAWLPLLGISALAAKTMNHFTRWANRTQGFLKQGNTRPFTAIGLVAAPLTFIFVALLS